MKQRTMAHTTTLRGISSMATQAVLAELAGDYLRDAGVTLALESVGGVDAAKRLRAGETFDLVFLARDAIDALAESGHVLTGSRVDLVRSAVSVAVPAGAPVPDIGTEAALQRAVLAAPRIGYSTGPSGVALTALFARWGVLAQLQDRLVQAPPGVPVGRLLAQGEVALGFQQTSELLQLPGITVLGPMPAEVAIVTTFSGGVCAACQQVQAAQALLRYFASPATLAAKRRQGMEQAPALEEREHV